MSLVARRHASKVYDEQENREVSTDYGQIRDTYGIFIPNEVMVKQSELAINRYQFLDEEKHKPFPSEHQMYITVLDLERFSSELDVYALEVFFKTGFVVENAPEFINRASELLKRHELSKGEVELMLKVEDERGVGKALLEERRAEGEAKGAANKTTSTIKNMLKENLELTLIAKIAEVPISKVQEIQAQLCSEE